MVLFTWSPIEFQICACPHLSDRTLSIPIRWKALRMPRVSSIMSLEFVQDKEKEFKCMHVILAEQFYHWKTQVTSINITEQPVKVRSGKKKKKKDFSHAIYILKNRACWFQTCRFSSLTTYWLLSQVSSQIFIYPAQPHYTLRFF